MKLNITVQDKEVSMVLDELSKKVKNSKELMGGIGKASEVILKEHFDGLNKKPNKNNWSKTNFWKKIANRTTNTSFNNTSATITISSPAFAAKLFGGIAKPTGGRKYLAIPAREHRYGKTPSELDDKDELFFKKSKTLGKAYLAQTKGKKLEVQYFLVRSARIPKDPDALPDNRKFTQNLLNQLNQYFKNND